MELKTLALELGGIRPLQSEDTDPVYQAGWYVDPVTGQHIFYDPSTEKFYTMAGGVFIPMGYMNPAPKQVSVAPGDRLKISISFKYTGPAVTGVTGYYCLGTYGTFGFDEKIVERTSFNIPQVVTPPTSPNVSDSYTFVIPTNIGDDCDDIYVKIFGGDPSIASAPTTQYIFGYYNALIVVGIHPDISEFKITDFVKV